MATNPTLLCIHRDPAQLRVLEENGYELLTAATGHEGLRLFRSRPVDGIVLEYNLGLLDGAVIASEIKQVRPTIPIVMVAEHAELPERRFTGGGCTGVYVRPPALPVGGGPLHAECEAGASF